MNSVHIKVSKCIGYATQRVEEVHMADTEMVKSMIKGKRFKMAAIVCQDGLLVGVTSISAHGLPAGEDIM